MILCDLPYGMTACKWDVSIPLEDYIETNGKILKHDEFILQSYKTGTPFKKAENIWIKHKKAGLWTHYKRIIKDKGSIVLFGQEPFSSQVRNSNLDWYRYDWIWQKQKPSNFQLMNYQPGRVQENVMVFSKAKACFVKNGNTMNYYPQMIEREKIRKANVKIYGDTNDNILHNYKNGENDNYKEYDKKHPISILQFNTVAKNKFHQTQKPVELLKYLIETYTQDGEVILDNCMGSGSTGVAALNIGRKFIGIELESQYFEIAKNRIQDIVV